MPQQPMCFCAHLLGALTWDAAFINWYACLQDGQLTQSMACSGASVCCQNGPLRGSLKST